MEFLGTEKPVNRIEPVVSVCITTYQHVDYIEQCLKSVLEQQTSFSYEIIVGEDESTDGTRELCKRYAERFPDQIRLILRSREDVRYVHGNPTGRFNFLETLKNARGKYIALCDGDDYWIDSQKLQKQFDYMEANSISSLCFHNAYKVDPLGSKLDVFPNINENTKVEPEIIIEKGGGYCATNSVFFHRDVIAEMPQWFIDAHVGDYSLYLLAIQHGEIRGLADIMSCYRSGHKNSWSLISSEAKKIHKYLESHKTLLHNFNNYSDHRYQKSINKRIALEEIYSAVKILGSGKWKYLRSLSISHKKYFFSAFAYIFKRKIGDLTQKIMHEH